MRYGLQRWYYICARRYIRLTIPDQCRTFRAETVDFLFFFFLPMCRSGRNCGLSFFPCADHWKIKWSHINTVLCNKYTMDLMKDFFFAEVKRRFKKDGKCAKIDVVALHDFMRENCPGGCSWQRYTIKTKIVKCRKRLNTEIIPTVVVATTVPTKPLSTLPASRRRRISVATKKSKDAIVTHNLTGYEHKAVGIKGCRPHWWYF